jgi:hypothetical protein
MSNEKNIRQDLVLALAANWRAEGEYWSGTPADSRSQRCADQLLKAFGFDKNAYLNADTDYRELLAAHGVSTAGVGPGDRGTPQGKASVFDETKGMELAKMVVEEQTAGTKRSLEMMILEKLMWAFEHGYREGFEDGANAREARYKRPVMK